MQRKIGAYIRVSTEMQAQVVEGSLESQKHRMNSFVEFKNSQEKSWGKIVEYYVDELSAKDTKRPVYQRMMRDLREGKIDVILVTEISRINRNVLDFLLLNEELKKLGAKLISIKDQFDPSTPSGELMLLMMMNLAQFERKQTSERVAVNFHSRAVRGFRNGGEIILGYEKDPTSPATLKVNEEGARRVRQIFEIFLEEGTCGKTIKKLEVLSIRPKERENKKARLSNQGKWSRQALISLLRNQAYIGLREINTKNKDSDQKELKPWQQYQVVKASWPAILDKKIFEQAQSGIAKAELVQRHRLENASDPRGYFLTGILRCHECTMPYKGVSSHGKINVHRYYEHRKLLDGTVTCKIKRIRADDVEADLLRRLELYLRDEGLLEKIESKIDESSRIKLADYVAQLKFIESKIKELDKEANAVFKFLTEMGSEEGGQFVKEKIATISKEKSAYQVQLLEIDNYIRNSPSGKETRTQVIEPALKEFKNTWKKASLIQKKNLLSVLFKYIILEPEGLGVRFKRNNEGEEMGKVLPFNSSASLAKRTIETDSCESARSSKEFKMASGCLTDAGSSIDKSGGYVGFLMKSYT